MASEYTLSLKAVLDTTEVQQKLQQLKRAQQSADGQAGLGGQAQSFGQRNDFNLSRLNQVFTKLNQSISNLDKAISKLSTASVKQEQTAKTAASVQAKAATPLANMAKMQQIQALPASVTSKSSTMPVGVGNMSPFQKEWTQTKAYKNVSREIKKSLSVLSPEEIEVLSLRLGNVHSPLFAHNVMTHPDLSDMLLGKSYRKQYFAAKRAYDRQQFMNGAKDMKMLAGFVGGQVLGGLGESFSEHGYSKTGAVIGGLGQGVSSGLAAGWAAGKLSKRPDVALAVALTVTAASAAESIYTSIKKINTALKEASEAFEQNSQRLYQNARVLQQGRQSFFDMNEARTMLEKFQRDYKHEITPTAKDRKEAAEKESYWKQQADEAVKAYREMQAPEDFQAEEEARVEKYKGVDSDEARDILKKSQQKIADYQKEFQLAGARAAQIQNIHEQFKSILTFLDDIDLAAKKKKEQEAKEQQEKAKAEKEKVENYQENANDRARSFRYNDMLRSTQALAMQTLRTDENRMTPQKQFSTLAAELDELRKLMNKSLKEAYSLNKEMLEPGKTSKQLEELQKQRNIAIENAQSFESRAGVLESALSRIQNIVSQPDLSHMTSLAQYGFSMGEKDDSVQAMEKYYSKMTDLTKQIRDKIDQGITTTATYN